MTDDQLDQRVRDRILAEEVDTSRVAAAVRNQIQTRQRHVPGWAVAAAALIVTALAARFSYQMFQREQTPPLCIAAAHDHNSEIAQGMPRKWLSDLSSIQSLAAQQGVPAAAITALNTTGYHLERGRLCFLQKQIFLHLVYTKHDDVFSVYLRPRDSESRFGPSVHQVSVGTEDLAYFQTDRLTAVFVAEESKSNAWAFANAGAKVL